MGSPTNGDMTPTPDQNASAIARLTSAVDMLVSQFIRPNAQQANANRETLDEIAELMNRHAQAIIDIDERLETIAQQQQTNTQQISANAEAIAQNTEAIDRLDKQLEETRTLVAENGSQIAQMGTRHDQMFARLDERLERIDQQQARNGQQIEALAEASRTQLAAIIGNGRRIDRLEQQAS